MLTQRVDDWDGRDLCALLSLQALGDGRWCSTLGDANLNGRSYGGQTLGQAVAAASFDVPSGRSLSALQAMFLQGADPNSAIHFQVREGQRGRRFCTRQVQATQGPRVVLEASVSFALPLEAPEHACAADGTEENPDELPPLETTKAHAVLLRRLSGYGTVLKPAIDFRLPDQRRQLTAGDARIRYWLRTARTLPDQAANPHLHAAALAYLSDFWLNFACLAPHAAKLAEGTSLYVSSLNHALWVHRPCPADEWLHVSAHSPCASQGRGLTMATFHDRAGRLVASATQEALMVPSAETARA